MNPWPEPVDGAELLYAIEAVFRRVVFTSDEQRILISLYPIFTHCIGNGSAEADAFDIAPRLCFRSVKKASGKSTVLKVMAALVARPEPSITSSPAQLRHALNDDHSTLLLDEGHQWMRPTGPIMAILNGGHERFNAYARLMIGGKSVRFSTFGAAIVAAKGNPFQPEFLDRAICVQMKKAKPAERANLEKFRRTSEMTDLASKAARWASDNIPALRALNPEMPSGLDARAEDNLRPLLAIADLARGGWPERVRQAIQVCYATGDNGDDDDEATIIRDCVGIFREQGQPRLRSAYLVTELVALDKAYRNFNQNQLSRALDEYEIHPKNMRFGPEETWRGYELSQFDDAVERYDVVLDGAQTSATRPPPATSATTATPPRNAVDAYMTAPAVAEAIFATTLRVLDAERAAATTHHGNGFADAPTRH
jgi:putative DNA primase/helicase